MSGSGIAIIICLPIYYDSVCDKRKWMRLPDLHIKASEWFDRQGMHREAIKHSLAAKDYERAGTLIESIGIDVMEQGGNSTVV